MYRQCVRIGDRRMSAQLSPPLSRWMDDAVAMGIDPDDAVPPITRFLWRRGLRTTPPLLSSPRAVFWWASIYFGLAMFTLLGLPAVLLVGTVASGAGWIGLLILVAGICFAGGFCFGWMMSRGVRAKQAELDLPAFDAYIE